MAPKMKFKILSFFLLKFSLMIGDYWISIIIDLIKYVLNSWDSSSKVQHYHLWHWIFNYFFSEKILVELTSTTVNILNLLLKKKWLKSGKKYWFMLTFVSNQMTWITEENWLHPLDNSFYVVSDLHFGKE